MIGSTASGQGEARTRRRYLAAAATIVLLVTLAFMQVLPRPDALSSEASASRILELLLVGVALLWALSTRRNAGPPLADSAQAGGTIVAIFAAWAFLTAFWSALPMTAAVKALELGALAATAWRLVAV